MAKRQTELLDHPTLNGEGDRGRLAHHVHRRPDAPAGHGVRAFAVILAQGAARACAIRARTIPNSIAVVPRLYGPELYRRRLNRGAFNEKVWCICFSSAV